MTHAKSYHRLDCFAAVARPPVGYDSVLPASRVLNLLRLIEHADDAGASGAIEWFICFSRSPLSVDELDVVTEFDRSTA